jgi:hypothetical protein
MVLVATVMDQFSISRL